MTHPFHPLCGFEFDVIQIKQCWGDERVAYLGGDGKVRFLSTSWTSVAPEDPFVRVAAGRAAFRVSDLLALASLLDGLAGEDRAGRETHRGRRSVK